MYGSGLKVRVASRQEIDGEPVERVEVPLKSGQKNVLLVLRVGVQLRSDEVQQAAEWLGEQCTKMSGTTCSYHGVVLFDSEDYKLDVVDVDDNT